MPRSVLLLLPLLLGACSDKFRAPPEVYARAGDRLAVSLGLEWLLGYPCFDHEEKTDGGFTVAIYLPTDQCYRFNPPERITGIWINEFEGSELLTEAEYAKGAWRHSPTGTWLDMDKHWPRDESYGTAYRIVLVGRRTTYPGRYGHMGASRNLVIVDRLEKIDSIAPGGSTTRN